MADVQVTCITRAARTSGYEGITHIGGPGGTGWRWTVGQVIDSLKAKTNTFYTLVDGKRADIGVVEGKNGDYLRTYADKQWNDNLLALPACP
jgi:hypothetical protein